MNETHEAKIKIDINQYVMLALDQSIIPKFTFPSGYI